MFRLKKILFCLTLFFTSSALNAQNMNNEKLEKIIYTLSDSLIGESGQWQFIVNEVTMLCVTDENNNRMRIIAPVAETSSLTENDLRQCMEANFHSALDVKYAISDDLLWVAFIHPLGELTKGQAIDAIKQVYSAAITYGTTYSSTHLVFPKSDDGLSKG